MELVATIIIDGLIYGAWLFIVSLGLTLVFGVLNILNIAHGSPMSSIARLSEKS